MVGIANASGSISKTYTYDAFGVELSPTSSDANPFRYSGEYFDAETGDYYLRARCYAPGLGRFLSEDPVRDGDNWYMYYNNNPVKFSDPNGEFAVLALVGALAVGAIVCAAVDLGPQLISNKGDLSSVNWRSVGVSAVSGVVTTGMTAVTAGASMTAGTLISGTGYGTYNLVNGSEATPEGYAIAMGTGALLGGARHELGKVGSSGKGNSSDAGCVVELSKNNVQQIKKHTFSGMKEQARFLTDEQLSKKLSSTSFFNKPWTDEEIVKYFQEAYNLLRNQGKTELHSVKINSETIYVFIKENDGFDTAYGAYKYTLEDFR